MTHDEMQKLIRDLSGFAQTGVPAPQGLRHLATQMKQEGMRRMYEGIAASLERGVALSQALAQATPPPPVEFVAAIQCGEASGDMGAVLKFALEHAQRVKRHHSAMLTVLFYPAMVLIVALGVILLFLNVVIPKFDQTFAQLGAERLPGPTEFLMLLSAHRVVSLAILALIALVIFGLVLASRRGTAPVIMKALDLFVPLASMSDGAILARFLGVMLQRGTTMPAALRAASLAVWLKRTRVNLLKIAGEVEKGFTAGPMMDLVLPPTAAYLFLQAEQRGETPQACQGIAEYCEENFDLLSDRLTRLLGPILVVSLGIIIGGMVIVLWMPIFNIGAYLGF